MYFHYDDTGLLAEYDASGQLISEYQYQPGNHWMTHPLFKRDGFHTVTPRSKITLVLEAYIKEWFNNPSSN